MISITLNPPKTITINTPVTRTLSSATVASVTDDASAKTVKANLREGPSILLWEGAAYDAIGQWTDTDVLARLNVILGVS